jgi:hypothetical protein
MKKPGRPSLEELDREDIVYMAELWCAGAAGLSISKIARIVAGLEAASMTSISRYSREDEASMKPKPSSTAKRLERRFIKLRDEHKAIGLSVYQVREQERKRAMRDSGEATYSAFHKDDREHLTFQSAEIKAELNTARRCGIEKRDVEGLASVGLETLRDWFPHEFPESRT